jgi:hypothetical protein
MKFEESEKRVCNNRFFYRAFYQSKKREKSENFYSCSRAGFAFEDLGDLHDDK